MTENKKVLLLVGSPKIKNSTSGALGDFMLGCLEKKGNFETEMLNIASVLKNNADELVNKAKEADILIISFPLYVDCLPSPVIKALELIASHRKGIGGERQQSIAVIVNCGFPESGHNNTAVKICEIFAKKAGYKWLGALTMGGGPAIDGKPLDKLGGMVRNTTKALDEASEDIAAGKTISSATAGTMSAGMIPVWMYTLIGSLGWKNQAKANRVKKQMYAKPYLKI